MKQISKVLIANRGEIALRIIRACRELNIETVAVYSTADSESLHVKFADEAVCIGPPAPKDSYLNISQILSAADITRCDALHPGYGFLSENADFARLVEECGMVFIGPNSKAIAAMGEKTNARAIAKSAGLPLLPGTLGAVSSVDVAILEARNIGYPVVLKAAGGGGGRGIHILREEAELQERFHRATSEALAAFGNGDLYLEKYCDRPRHIEVQVLADKHGQVLHLGERECSIQRRHQKIIEEAPSAVVSPELREKMTRASIQLCKAVGYDSVGTVEFLMDASGGFYFMEMNTRIQVEHPVTEQVTGVDLVKQQILVAQGEPLKLRQKDIQIRGHAIECRINAEHPWTLRPSPGLIQDLYQPGGAGIRIDGFIYRGYKVQPYYDSLCMKIISYAENRELAIAKMRQALDELQIIGIETNTPLHVEVLQSPRFVAAEIDTFFLEELLKNYR